MNRAIGESGFAQWRKIVFGNLLRMKRELQRIIDQTVLPLVKRSRMRIAFEGGEQFIIFNERTKSLPVMLHSIMAIQYCPNVF